MHTVRMSTDFGNSGRSAQRASATFCVADLTLLPESGIMRYVGGSGMGGIFILHCESDRGLAEELRSKLAELADRRNVEFVSLASTVSEGNLGAEMSAAGALVALLSDSAKRDSRVMMETGLAVSLGKPVVAVIIDETEPETLDFIEARVWIPSAGRRPPDDLARAIHEAVMDLLTETDAA
jgi:hypothetical protein